jgi:hypothetical protein
MPAAAIPSLGEWHGRGLCIGADPDIFFPAHGATGTQAKQVCAACAVREECLKYATDADEVGIWGGLDQMERRSLKRRQRRRQAAGRAEAESAALGCSDGGAA